MNLCFWSIYVHEQVCQVRAGKYDPKGGDFPSERRSRYFTYRKAKGTTFAQKNIVCSTTLFQKEKRMDDNHQDTKNSPDQSARVRVTNTHLAILTQDDVTTENHNNYHTCLKSVMTPQICVVTGKRPVNNADLKNANMS